jgi:hypothetical protein
MSVSCDCCVFSGSNLCNGLITRPEESYRLWRVYLRVSLSLDNEQTVVNYSLLRHGHQQQTDLSNYDNKFVIKYIFFVWLCTPSVICYVKQSGTLFTESFIVVFNISEWAGWLCRYSD